MANDVIRALEKLKLSGRAFDYDPKSRFTHWYCYFRDFAC